jgi:thiol:disulfide interchange protein DsbC
MKKILISALLSLSLFSGMQVAMADTPQETAMLAKIQKAYPTLSVEKVTWLPNVKLYQVDLKDTYVPSYTNENIDYFILQGQVIDPKNKTNISAQADTNEVVRMFKSLPTKDAIVYKYGKGTRKIAIFTDPDCPFCRATDQDIHTNLTKSDVTIYYYMNPLTGIQGHEDAAIKAAKLWCSPDRNKAWLDWMLRGQMPTNAGTCDNPVARTRDFAAKIGFNSTPTLIFDNGFVYRGQIDSANINAILSKRPAM